MGKSLRPFHLAFPVLSIEKTKEWYTEILGCSVGRESERWIDFNFFGHQISAHLSDSLGPATHNQVDSKEIPSRHFGIILIPSDWDILAKRLTGLKIKFKVDKVRDSSKPIIISGHYVNLSEPNKKDSDYSLNFKYKRYINPDKFTKHSLESQKKI